MAEGLVEISLQAASVFHGPMGTTAKARETIGFIETINAQGRIIFHFGFRDGNFVFRHQPSNLLNAHEHDDKRSLRFLLSCSGTFTVLVKPAPLADVRT